MTTIKHHRYKQNRMNPLQPSRLLNRPEVWRSEKPCINKRKSIKMLSSHAGPHETRRIFGTFFKYHGSPSSCTVWSHALKLWYVSDLICSGKKHNYDIKMSVSMWTQSCGFVFCVSNYERWSEWEGGTLFSVECSWYFTPFVTESVKHVCEQHVQWLIEKTFRIRCEPSCCMKLQAEEPKLQHHTDILWQSFTISTVCHIVPCISVGIAFKEHHFPQDHSSRG